MRDLDNPHPQYVDHQKMTTHQADGPQTDYHNRHTGKDQRFEFAHVKKENKRYGDQLIHPQHQRFKSATEEEKIYAKGGQPSS